MPVLLRVGPIQSTHTPTPRVKIITEEANSFYAVVLFWCPHLIQRQAALPTPSLLLFLFLYSAGTCSQASPSNYLLTFDLKSMSISVQYISVYGFVKGTLSSFFAVL